MRTGAAVLIANGLVLSIGDAATLAGAARTLNLGDATLAPAS